MTVPLIFRPGRVALVVGDPSQEPVGMQEIYLHGAHDSAEHGALLAGYIKSAREWVEWYCGRALLEQTRVYKLDRFPASNRQLIELPGGSLFTGTNLVSIDYIDENGAAQTWAPAEFLVDQDHAPGRIGLAYQESWPTIRQWDLPVSISYDVGYGDNPGDVPEPLRTAISMIASELFERRETSIAGTIISEVPFDAKRLCNGERIRAQF